MSVNRERDKLPPELSLVVLTRAAVEALGSEKIDCPACQTSLSAIPKGYDPAEGQHVYVCEECGAEFPEEFSTITCLPCGGRGTELIQSINNGGPEERVPILCDKCKGRGRETFEQAFRRLELDDARFPLRLETIIGAARRRAQSLARSEGNA